MRISSAYSGRTRRRSLTSLSENRQLPRRSAPGIIAAEVHAMNEVATTFLTLGAVSYGGAGVLGMMQAEIQQKHGWLSKERFLEGLALSNLLPGPPSAQLAMFLGYARGMDGRPRGGRVLWAAAGRQAARSQMPSQMILVASIGGAPSF